MPERSPPGACVGPPPLVLRNGSARDRPLPQVLEPQQHGQHPFELAIEADLVTTEPLQLVGVERFAERLLARQRTAIRARCASNFGSASISAMSLRRATA